MFTPSLQKRKNYIANIAAKEFLSKGYKTASLEDIGNKVGMSKAGLYHYFKTKEEILYYILINMTNNFLGALRNCVKECEAEGLEPEDALKKYLTKYADNLNTSGEAPLLILRERHQLTGKFKTELHELEQEIFNGIRKELKKVPQINEKYDLNVIAFLIISVSHWIGYWMKPKGKLDLESVIKQNIDIIFNGIFKS